MAMKTADKAGVKYKSNINKNRLERDERIRGIIHG